MMPLPKDTKVREIHTGHLARVVRSATFVTPYDIQVFYVIEYDRTRIRSAVHSDGIERVA